MQLVSKNTINGNNSGFNITSVNIQVGDLLLAFVSLDGDDNTLSSPPANWIRVNRSTVGHLSSEIWYKIANSTDVNNKGYYFGTLYSNQYTATMMVVRGVNTSNPIGNIDTNSNFNAPSIYARKDSWLVTHFTSHSNQAYIVPSGMTQVSNIKSADYASSMVAYEERTREDWTGTRTAGGEATNGYYENIAVSLEILEDSSSLVLNPIPGVEIIGSNTANSSGNSISLPIPVDTKFGDLMVAFVSLDNDVNSVTSAPNGWIKKVSSPSTEFHLSAEIWYKIANSSDVPSTPVVFSTSVDEEYTATITSFRNIDQTNPIGNVASAFSNSAPSIEMFKDRNVLITHHTAHSNIAMTVPYGMTTISSLMNSGFASSIVSYEERSSGWTGIKTSDGEIAISLELNYKEPNVAPTKPGSFSEPVTSKQKNTIIDVRWGASSDLNVEAFFYRLEYKYGNGSWVLINNALESNFTKFNIEDVNETSLQFRVQARDISGATSEWTISNVITLLEANKSPLPVAKFTAPIGKLNKNGTYRVQWDASSDPDFDAISYSLEVQYDDDAYLKIASGFTENYRDYKIVNNNATTVNFRVKVVDIYGLESVYTKSNLLSLNDIPAASASFVKPAVTNLTRGTEYEIEWQVSQDPNFDVVSYTLEYSYDNVNFTLITNTSKNSYTWTTPSSLTYQYVWFKVYAKDTNGGVSDYTLSRQFILNSKPNKPVWSLPNTGDILRPGSEINVSWTGSDPDNDKLTYNLLVSYNNATPKTVLENISGTTAKYTVESNIVNGKIVFYVIAKDDKGLLSDRGASNEITVQSAPKPPTINMSPINWTSGNVDVSIIHGANTGGGVFGSEYRISNGVWQTYLQPFTITQEGETLVEARTLDSNYFASDVASRTAKIDRQKPDAPILTLSTESWTNEDVEITIVDGKENGGSGILRSEYKINEGEWQIYIANKSVVSVEGVSIVYARTIDNANNISSVVQKTVKIDKTRPTKPAIILDSGEWVKDNVSFTIVLATDTMSTVHQHEYRINEGEWSVYSGKVTISSNGYSKIYARALDYAGNYSYEDTKTIKIDKTPPEEPIISVSYGGWTKNDVSFTIQHGKDDLSGPAYSEFKINNGEWQRYVEQYNVSNEGVITIYARTIDNMGNVSGSNTATIKIDKTKPTKPLISLSHTDWTRENVTITITGGQDLASGIERIEYMIGTGNWQTYRAPFAISNNGQTTIYTRAVDNAGNVSDQSSAVVKIDKDGPNEPILTVSDENWTNKDVIVNIEKDESVSSLSGVKSIEYRIGNNSWVPYYGPFTINLEGQISVYARTVDNAGATSGEVSKIVRIDKTAPNNPTISISNSNWTTGSNTFTIVTGADSISGVKETQYRIGLDGEWVKYTTPQTISTSGLISIFARTVDKANNVSKMAYVISRIDKTGITGEIIINDGKATISGATNLVKLTLTGNDSGSGAVEYMVSNSINFDGAEWQYMKNKIKATIRTTSALFSEVGVVTNKETFDRFFDETEPQVGYRSTHILDNVDWTTSLVPEETENYSIEHIGYYTPTKTGAHEFGIISGDAGEVYVDGNLIVSLYNNAGMSNDFKRGTMQLTAGREYKITVKSLRNGNSMGAKLGIRRPDDTDMFIAPPELFFKAKAVEIVNSWNLGNTLGMNIVYAKFRDATGSVSPTYSDGIMRNSFPTGDIISPVSQVGYLLSKRPKIVVQFNDEDQDAIIDFRVQISKDSAFADLIIDDTATSTPNTGWVNINPTTFDTKVYTPNRDIDYGTIFIRSMVRDRYGWGEWSAIVETELRNPNWSETISNTYTGVRKSWLTEIRDKIYPLKGARGTGYYQNFKSATFQSGGITIDKTGQYVKITSTDEDPFINMYNIGNFSPSKYRYFIIRYRLIEGEPDGGFGMFYRSNDTPEFVGDPPVSQAINIPPVTTSWQIAYCDTWKNPNWNQTGMVTGWRLSLGNKASIVYEIDYIALVDNYEDIDSSKIISNSTPVKLTHLSNLRGSLDEINDTFGKEINWTDKNLLVNTTERKGLHWLELRTNIENS